VGRAAHGIAQPAGLAQAGDEIAAGLVGVGMVVVADVGGSPGFQFGLQLRWLASKKGQPR
jgi:hypothetical protein